MAEESEKEGEPPKTELNPDPKNPIVRICAIIGAILGVFSSGLAIWLSWENHRLSVISEDHKRRIEDQQSELNKNADVRAQFAELRADTAVTREYIVKVYDKVVDALQGTDLRKQQVALALVSTLPDAEFRERLSSVFRNTNLVTNEQLLASAAKIQDAANAEIQGWSYGIYWCNWKPKNENVALSVKAALDHLKPRRITVQPWTNIQNNATGYHINDMEIRYVAMYKDVAVQIKSVIDNADTKFNLTEIDPNHIIANYVGIFACG